MPRVITSGSRGFRGAAHYPGGPHSYNFEEPDSGTARGSPWYLGFVLVSDAAHRQRPFVRETLVVGEAMFVHEVPLLDGIGNTLKPILGSSTGFSDSICRRRTVPKGTTHLQ